MHCSSTDGTIFKRNFPFPLFLFPFLSLQALELSEARSNLRWTTKTYETGDSLKSSRLHSCPKTGSTASNPFLRDIYLSCVLKSPGIETPQSIKVIPYSASDAFLLSKLNHPCWELMLLPSTENNFTLFSPSLQWCETRIVLLSGLCSVG